MKKIKSLLLATSVIILGGVSPIQAFELESKDDSDDGSLPAVDGKYVRYVDDIRREKYELWMTRGATVDQAMNNGATPLHIAAQKGRRDVCALLLAKGATVDQASDDGYTPLHVAAQEGHREVCELLLAKGADPLKRDWRGRTPIGVAKTEEIRQILKRY